MVLFTPGEGSTHIRINKLVPLTLFVLVRIQVRQQETKTRSKSGFFRMYKNVYVLPNSLNRYYLTN
ncbi:hypothetical protein SAMN05428988_3135 [Chitinophaga sp. YR573]|nr:hypothetical protein SAMN05428988_3135 [Chitinophaga sp. YR573]